MRWILLMLLFFHVYAEEFQSQAWKGERQIATQFSLDLQCPALLVEPLAVDGDYHQSSLIDWDPESGLTIEIEKSGGTVEIGGIAIDLPDQVGRTFTLDLEGLDNWMLPIPIPDIEIKVRQEGEKVTIEEFRCTNVWKPLAIVQLTESALHLLLPSIRDNFPVKELFGWWGELVGVESSIVGENGRQSVVVDISREASEQSMIELAREIAGTVEDSGDLLNYLLSEYAPLMKEFDLSPFEMMAVLGLHAWEFRILNVAGCDQQEAFSLEAVREGIEGTRFSTYCATHLELDHSEEVPVLGKTDLQLDCWFWVLRAEQRGGFALQLEIECDECLK